MPSITTTTISLASAQAAQPATVHPAREGSQGQYTTVQQLAQISKNAADQNSQKARESKKRGILDPHARVEGSFAPEEQNQEPRSEEVAGKKRPAPQRHRGNIDLEA
jgi:hypothetical protein